MKIGQLTWAVYELSVYCIYVDVPLQWDFYIFPGKGATLYEKLYCILGIHGLSVSSKRYMK